MAKRVTEEEKARMRELRADGWTYVAIGREVCRSHTAVMCACDPGYNARQEERYHTPEYKERKKAIYSTPEYKAKNRARAQTLEYKAVREAYWQTPEYKAAREAHNKKADMIAWYKAYEQTQERKSSKRRRRATPEYKAKEKEYQQSERRKEYNKTTQRRLSMILRNRIAKAINRGQKAGSAVRDLGCTIKQLKAHLESQFKPGMTWDNWEFDGWHIDHIKPLASFDLTDREQFLQACHYTNLQPLWAEENLSKGAKAPAEWRERQLATA